MIKVEDDVLSRINAEEYDIDINLDTSKVSSAIAASSTAKEKLGIVLKKGQVESTPNAAQQWLEMNVL